MRVDHFLQINKAYRLHYKAPFLLLALDFPLELRPMTNLINEDSKQINHSIF